MPKSTDVKHVNHNNSHSLSYLQLINELPERANLLNAMLIDYKQALKKDQNNPRNESKLRALIQAERAFLEARVQADRFQEVIVENNNTLKAFNKDLKGVTYKSPKGTFDVQGGMISIYDPFNLTDEQKQEFNTFMDEKLAGLPFWDAFDYGVAQNNSSTLPDTGFSGFKLVGHQNAAGKRDRPNRASDFLATRSRQVKGKQGEYELAVLGVSRKAGTLIEIAVPGGFGGDQDAANQAALLVAIRECIEETRSGRDDFGRGGSTSAHNINMTISATDFKANLKKSLQAMIEKFNASKDGERFPAALGDDLLALCDTKLRKSSLYIDGLYAKVKQYMDGSKAVHTPKLLTTINDFLLATIMNAFKLTVPYKDFTRFIEENAVCLQTQLMRPDFRATNDACNSTDAFFTFFDPANPFDEFMGDMGLLDLAGGDDADKAGWFTPDVLTNGGELKALNPKTGKKETVSVKPFCKGGHGMLFWEGAYNVLAATAPGAENKEVAANIQQREARQLFVSSLSYSTVQTVTTSLQLYNQNEMVYAAISKKIRDIQAAGKAKASTQSRYALMPKPDDEDDLAVSVAASARSVDLNTTPKH